MRLCFSFLEFAFFSKYAKIMLQAHPVAFFYLLYVNVRFPLAFLFIPLASHFTPFRFPFIMFLLPSNVIRDLFFNVSYTSQE
jgi:hypothetical protein